MDLTVQLVNNSQNSNQVKYVDSYRVEEVSSLSTPILRIETI